MKTNCYNVFDRDGNIILENVTSREISEKLDVPFKRVTKCHCSGQYLRGKYKIEKIGEVLSSEEKIILKFLAEEWEKAVAPFKKVVWTKEYGPGVKMLGVKKVG